MNILCIIVFSPCFVPDPSPQYLLLSSKSILLSPKQRSPLPPPPACDMQECDPLYKRLFVKRKNVRYKPPDSLALVMTAADVLIALHTSTVPCNNNYSVVQVVPYTLAGIKEHNVIKSTISDIGTSVRRSSGRRSGVVK